MDEHSNDEIGTKQIDTDKNPVVKKKKTRYFETYISKVLKSITTSNGITANAKQQLNSAICVIAQFLATKATHLTIISKKKTMSVKEISNSIKLSTTVNFSNLAIKHAEDSVETFLNVDTKHSSRQKKAGILFPPSISEKFLRNFGFSKIMITRTAPVYFASILEFIVFDILSLSTKMAIDNNRSRITIRDLEMSVRTNKDMCHLFENCKLNFIGGGVVPQIHESLLNKKPRKKRNKIELEEGNETKKGHRFRPGTVSLREIRKFQKTSNCLTFAKFPFERFVRGMVNNYNDGMKISKDVFIVLQYYIEQFVVDFLRDANSAAIHSGRVKLMPSDISFICNLRKYTPLNVDLYKISKREEGEEDVVLIQEGDANKPVEEETDEPVEEETDEPVEEETDEPVEEETDEPVEEETDEPVEEESDEPVEEESDEE
jgi:histone H3/H4